MATIPYFGRAWQITINTQDGNRYVLSSAIPNPNQTTNQQPFKVVFSVDTYMQLVYWRADITIYNPSDSNIVVRSGDAVTLSAGYESGDGYGQFSPNNCLLFSGIIFQPIWTRLNVVDRILKLRCIFGWMEDTLNLLSFNMPAGATFYATLNALADHANGIGGPGWAIDADAGAVSKLSGTAVQGTQILDGKPYALVQNIMRQSTLFAWVTPAPTSSDDQTPATIHVRSFDERPTTPDVIYGPPNLPNPPPGARLTLLEIPQQTMASQVGTTQFGVVFRVLLDPTIRNGQVVQIAQGTVVAPYEFTPLQEYPPVASPEGMYIVSGVRHVGDSRGHGEDWYTEITGATWDFFSAYINGSSPIGVVNTR